MNNIIMKMTSAYDFQDFYKEIPGIHMLNFFDLPGTRCYLDEDAKSTIIEQMAPLSYEGIHFIDSGNYHYLSLLFLLQIKEDFNLVLFDHHPDNQPPSFGSITSCGGWVLEATEQLPHLKKVFTYGTGQEIPIDHIPMDLPIYISIDKDILDRAYAITDWDQGDMSLDTMLSMLESICKNRKILGVDVSGDSGEDAENGAFVNNQTNAILFDFLSKKF
ncbi:MAG: hypothetical protein K5773_04155 [Pseudobutyrivibrio sp.]|nr:hypothetical protein [Pseudobutyrivibrio sp.]